MQTATTSLDIATIRTATAEKLSGGEIEFEVGRERGTDNLFLRIMSNDSSGTFSKEWVAVDAVREALAAKGGDPFKPGPVMQAVYVGKSKNNGPFLAHALRSLGFLSLVGEKDSSTTVSGDWDEFVEECLGLPVPDPEPEPTEEEEPKAKKAAKGKRGRAKAKSRKADTQPADPNPEIAEEPEPD